MITLLRITDPRGDLTFVEGNQRVPFDTARAYYLYNAAVDAERGEHAHRSLQQVIFALSGRCRLRLDGDRGIADDILLRDPSVGVYFDRMTLHELDQFSQGSVSMVLASEPYEAAEYIRDRAEFDALAAAERSG